MIITNCNTTKRGKIAIYVDGDFLFTVDKESFLLSKIQIGQTTTQEELDTLLSRSGIRLAKSKALSLVSQRSYTAKQLSGKLLKHTDKESALEIVERFEELGIINDTDYAGRYARDLYNLKLYAPAGIKQALREKGIARDIIDTTLEQFDTDIDIDRAISYIKRRYARFSEEKIQKRAAAALQRLGYGYSDIRAAIRILTEELEGEYDEN